MSTPLEEKDAIRELMAAYCFRFDSGDFDRWLDLFTEDGVFDVSSIGRFAGREALRNFLKVVPLTNGVPMLKHCVMNSIVRVDGDRATAQSYVIVVRGGANIAVSVAGRYEDQLIKRADGWRFSERKALLDMLHVD